MSEMVDAMRCGRRAAHISPKAERRVMLALSFGWSIPAALSVVGLVYGAHDLTPGDAPWLISSAVMAVFCAAMAFGAAAGHFVSFIADRQAETK